MALPLCLLIVYSVAHFYQSESDRLVENLNQYFATCPKGMEELLANELAGLGALNVKQTVAGVQFEGDKALGYRSCLWSRLANRILLLLKRTPATTADQIYEAAYSVDWESHLDPDGCFAVDFTGSSEAINNTHFGAMKVKDGVVDRMRAELGRRPDADSKRADIRVNARLAKGKLVLSLDLSGASLHRRGYRSSGGPAPLKENLAAALLIRAGWPQIASAGGSLLDPMCGSGTLLTEGALIAADIAPGSLGRSFGFEFWQQHDEALWKQLLAEAQQRREAGLEKLPTIMGFDSDAKAVAKARHNRNHAGFHGLFEIETVALQDLQPDEIKPGLLICNPPYGERLGEVNALREVYALLGEKLRQCFGGWEAAVFTSNQELADCLRLKAGKRYQLMNGQIPGTLFLYTLYSASDKPAAPESAVPHPAKPARPGRQLSADPHAPGVIMVANRLRKNQKRLANWLQQAQTDCYRLYDADLPEYAAAVDLYGEQVQVSEYAPPASVDPVAAQRRLEELLLATSEVLAIEPDAIAVKQRARQKGSSQYQKRDNLNRFFEVTEGKARLLVNLHDYLDTGLFLDHRPLRFKIGQWAQGARFLNLFCYTATATVHAVLGGARASVSVDMSKIYLEWAQRNFDLNSISSKQHRLVQANCLEWLATESSRYDLILLDPPTFSNSKNMEGTLDIQRDHVQLINSTAKLLAPDGRLIFSTNYRGFKLDGTLEQNLQIENISAQTLDMDFARRPKIHQCWVMSRVRG